MFKAEKADVELKSRWRCPPLQYNVARQIVMLPPGKVWK